MEWLALWMLWGVVAAAIAASKRQSAIKYFVYGVLFAPLGIVLAILAKPNENAAIKAGVQARCPHCAELIRPEANVCRFCGRDIIERSAAQARLAASGLDGIVLREEWNEPARR